MENAVHTINLDRLVDHKDYCQMHGRVFLHNCTVYSAGIGVPGFLVEAQDIYKTYIAMKD